mmetsp:Transcript_5689/g.25282  ORF Transcript_5689/g.25282 Transcript_5689/m.25282 type:complete len:354 (+) Transcript_5689:480-1541(+)
MDRHLGEHVPVVVAGGLIRRDVRHGEERASGESALDLVLDLVGNALDVFRGEISLIQLVERLLKVRHGDHAAEHEHLERVLLPDGPLQQVPGNGGPGSVLCVSAQPRGVAAEGVEKHRLRLREGHRERRALLAEERGALLDVCEVRGVPALVHQGGEGGVSASHLVRGGERREVSLARVPGAVLRLVRGDGPVAEPVGVLALSIAEVQLHLGVAVPDPHRGERTPPNLGSVFKRKVRVHLAAELAAERVGDVPGLERVLALVCLELGERRVENRPRRALQTVEHLEASRLAEALRLRHLHVVKVDESERPRESVPLGDDLGEAVLEEEGSHPARRLPAGLPHGLVGGAANLGA